MRKPTAFGFVLCSALALTVWLAAGSVASADGQVAVGTASLRIDGTSNLHDWHASTTTVRVTKIELGAAASGDLWAEALEPGVVSAFEVAIPAETLKSGEGGLDKNMYKALNIEEHPEITFSLARFEPGAAPDTLRAVGTVSVAGVQREVAFDITTAAQGASLNVKGVVELDMTEYGIKPPRAMLGMLRTGPKVKVSFDVVLAPGDAAANSQ
jgi:polyisoprenoid-binding protein YceI